MQEVKLNNVLEYLINSPLYKTFQDNEENDPIQISSKYYKKNTEVNSLEDLYYLFHTLRYWLVEDNDYPYQNIFTFVQNNKELDYEPFYKTFFDIPFIEQIKILLKSNNLCNSSCENGYLLLLQYAHENDCPWDKWTCMVAAENGQLECLRYAHENGCRWDEDTCTYAAWNGHLDCLKYAHENGCSWDEETCSYAAKNGYLECLKYAHENGCSWNEDTCYNAANNGHLDCLKYARDNGWPK